MRQLGTAAVISFGVAALVGGVCSLAYGLAYPGTTDVVGLGPLNGIWAPQNYCFLGGVLAALGAGLTTFGLLMRPRPAGYLPGGYAGADAIPQPPGPASPERTVTHDPHVSRRGG